MVQQFQGLIGGLLWVLVALWFALLFLPVILNITQGFRALATGYCTVIGAPDFAITRVPVGFPLSLANEEVTVTGNCSTATSDVQVQPAEINGHDTSTWKFNYRSTYLAQTFFGGIIRLLTDALPVLFLLQWVIPVLVAFGIYGKIRGGMGGGGG